MKKHIIAAAVLVAMLGLTACGESDTSEIASEKVAEATVDESAEEKATEAVTTEIVTTEEVTTEVSTEAVFKPVEELSDRYADTETMGFTYNGQVFKLGEATVQQILDTGLEMKSKDLDEEKISYGTVKIQIQISDSTELKLEFEKIPGQHSTPTAECVLSSMTLKSNVNVEVGDHTIEADVSGMKENEAVQFGFPFDMTKEELVANSGEPNRTKVAGALKMLSYYYTGPSLLEPDNDDRITECRFVFDGDTLYSYSAYCNKQDRDNDDDE